MVVDGKTLTVSMWDTVGDSDYDRLRPLSYPDSDIVMMCFSVIDDASFEEVKTKFLIEVKHFLPGVPVLLLGLKCDLRDPVVCKEHEVQSNDALQLAKDIGAVGYYETSALTGEGVEEAMTYCIRVAAGMETRSRRFGLPRAQRRHTETFSTNIKPSPPKPPPKEDVPPINIPSSTFAADWSKMVDNSSHSDVVLKVATKTYHAHRYVLACGSKGLRQLLGVEERVRGEGLDEGSSEEKIAQERINSGQVDGLLHIEERITKQGITETELTFDPDLVSEVAVSRVLTFLYTGVVELNKDSEGLEETIKMSELLNLPELRVICQNAQQGEEFCPSVRTERTVTITKQLFLNKPLFSDVRFRVEGELVHAHRLVLCARCEVMAAMLSGAFQESQANEIVITYISLDAFLLFLEYLYTDSVSLSEDNCTSVLELANRYAMDRLMALCELYISKQVEMVTADSIAGDDIQDVVDLLLMSQLYNAAQLSTWCLHFISTNYTVFENRSDEFCRLSGSNLDYVREHRWPPLSHEAAVAEYWKKQPQSKRDEKGGSRGAEGGEGRSKSRRNRLSRLFKRGK